MRIILQSPIMLEMEVLRTLKIQSYVYFYPETSTIPNTNFHQTR